MYCQSPPGCRVMPSPIGFCLIAISTSKLNGVTAATRRNRLNIGVHLRLYVTHALVVVPVWIRGGNKSRPVNLLIATGRLPAQILRRKGTVIRLSGQRLRRLLNSVTHLSPRAGNYRDYHDRREPGESHE